MGSATYNMGQVTLALGIIVISFTYIFNRLFLEEQIFDIFMAVLIFALGLVFLYSNLYKSPISTGS